MNIKKWEDRSFHNIDSGVEGHVLGSAHCGRASNCMIGTQGFFSHPVGSGVTALVVTYQLCTRSSRAKPAILLEVVSVYIVIVCRAEVRFMRSFTPSV